MKPLASVCFLVFLAFGCATIEPDTSSKKPRRDTKRNTTEKRTTYKKPFKNPQSDYERMWNVETKGFHDDANSEERRRLNEESKRLGEKYRSNNEELQRRLAEQPGRAAENKRQQDEAMKKLRELTKQPPKRD